MSADPDGVEPQPHDPWLVPSICPIQPCLRPLECRTSNRGQQQEYSQQHQRKRYRGLERKTASALKGVPAEHSCPNQIVGASHPKTPPP